MDLNQLYKFLVKQNKTQNIKYLQKEIKILFY